MKDGLRELGSDGRLVVHAALDLEGLAALRESLATLVTHPRADPELYLHNLQRSGDNAHPVVIVARQDGKAAGLLLGRVESKKLQFDLGPLPAYRTQARVLAICDRGALEGGDQDVAAALLRAVLRLLREGVADYAHLTSVSQDSPLWEQARRVRPWYCRALAWSTEPHWALTLPKSYDAFLATRSHKTRAHLRQNERALLREHPGLRAVTFRRGDPGLRAAYDVVMTVFRKTYQCRLGISPLSDCQARETWEELCQLRRLMLVVLYVDERPVAFCHAQLYKTAAFLITPGYDPDFAKVNVGQYALLQLIRALIADGNVRTLDYGMGYAQYKESLGTACTHDGHVRVFAPSPKGVWLNLIQATTAAGTAWLRGATRKLGFYRTLKRWHRRQV